MPVCDVCEKELTPKFNTFRLYAGKVSQHATKQTMTSTESMTTYERFKPVNVTVCSRHRKDLYLQRAMPAIFAFLLLFFPVSFLIGQVAKLTPINLWTQYIATVIVSAAVSYLLIRRITYEGLVAVLMTRQYRGLGVEYMTEKKFQRLMKRLPERKQRALTRTPSPASTAKKKKK